MQFCEECGNILLPLRKKNKLHCRVCDKDFSIGKEKEKLAQYKKVTKKVKKTHSRNRNKIVIVDARKKPSISADERDAMEDLFEAPSI
jgi:DNA-directed RNA polymerase subunit M/transcription elongation factor TFIIS